MAIKELLGGASTEEILEKVNEVVRAVNAQAEQGGASKLAEELGKGPSGD